MKKFFQQFLVSLLIVFSWRLALGIFLKLTNYQVEAQFPYYQSDLISKYPQSQTLWAHFDGVHYLRIANYGYRDFGTQAFFPIYPILIRSLTPIFGNPLITAELISLLSLVLAITALRYLFPSLKPYAISLILIFPTSFFLTSVYTESLFLAFSTWFFVLLKHKAYLPAAILASLASGTRLAGVFLAFALLYELYHAKYSIPKALYLMLLACSGLLAYMYYLSKTFDDPLMFIHVQPLFGGGRSGGEIVLLPQVIWRYLKIFFSVDLTTLVFQRALFEFSLFGAFTYALIKYWRALPTSQALYIALSLLLPSLSGTLSSVPRYVLVLFPFFLPLFPFKKYYLLYALSFMLFIWSFSTFARGYFIS